MGKALGWEDIAGIAGGRAWVQFVWVRWCCARGRTHQGPRWPRTVGPTGYLLALSSSPGGGASSSPVADRPHPAHPSDPLMSPWFSFPRLPGVQSSSRPWGKMAALGDSQEPPHVLSTVTFESPETPGACHRHEAQLHLHGHQHGTCLPAPSLRAGSSLGAGAPAPWCLGRDSGSSA